MKASFLFALAVFLPSPTIASVVSSLTPMQSASSTLTTTIPPAPSITTPPSLEDVTFAIQQKWHLTTYWSCATYHGGGSHCGWHEPVLPGGTEIAGGNRLYEGAQRAGLVAGAMVIGALLR